jgi:GAF domain-containing protein
MTDSASALDACLDALAEPGQPAPLYAAMDRALAGLVGHRLFTLLYVTADGKEVARCYSSNPASYPIGGRKPMGPTPWGDLVMRRQLPFLGRDAADIRWAFFDHALIESLGLRSAVNLPVRYDGRVLGTINLLDAEGHYEERHLALLRPFAALLIAPFLAAGR